MNYLIDYGNVKQIKRLISHSEYVEIIKPAYYKLDDLKARKRAGDNSVLGEIQHLSTTIASYGEWFTDESPLYEAIKTGVLVLLLSSHSVIITKV